MRTNTDRDVMNITEYVGIFCCGLALLYGGNLIGFHRGYLRGYLSASLEELNVQLRHKDKE
jgi:hypothetical protein